MSAQSLWIQIPEIIGIPLVALLIIGFIKAATAIEPFTNEQAVDLAMDCTVLATGACGSIFANDTLYAKWRMAAVVYSQHLTLKPFLQEFTGVLGIDHSHRRQG